jgi:hypothetical protein
VNSISKPSLREQDALLASTCSRLVQVAAGAVAAARSGVPGLRPERVLEALRRVVLLREDAWDLDPSLAPRVLESRLAADLDNLVALLDADLSGGVSEVGNVLAAILLEYAPEDVARCFRDEATRGDGKAGLRAWWSSCDGMRGVQSAPDIELASARRWRRVLAAIELRRGGGPDLMNASGTDIDRGALEHWHRTTRARALRLLE